jgi:hypothetical protein
VAALSGPVHGELVGRRFYVREEDEVALSVFAWDLIPRARGHGAAPRDESNWGKGQ